MKQTTVNDCRIVARSQEVLKVLKIALIEEQSEQKCLQKQNILQKVAYTFVYVIFFLYLCALNL